MIRHPRRYWVQYLEWQHPYGWSMDDTYSYLTWAEVMKRHVGSVPVGTMVEVHERGTLRQDGTREPGSTLRLRIGGIPPLNPD